MAQKSLLISVFQLFFFQNVDTSTVETYFKCSSVDAFLIQFSNAFDNSLFCIGFDAMLSNVSSMNLFKLDRFWPVYYSEYNSLGCLDNDVYFINMKNNQ